jgi:hypothetical protein
MAKALKTAAELTALINAELSKHEVCIHTSVEGISPIADERIDHNWTCKFLRRQALRHRRSVSRCLLPSCVNFSRSMILVQRSNPSAHLTRGTTRSLLKLSSHSLLKERPPLRVAF